MRREWHHCRALEEQRVCHGAKFTSTRIRFFFFLKLRWDLLRFCTPVKECDDGLEKIKNLHCLLPLPQLPKSGSSRGGSGLTLPPTSKKRKFRRGSSLLDTAFLRSHFSQATAGSLFGSACKPLAQKSSVRCGNEIEVNALILRQAVKQKGRVPAARS